MEHEEASVRPFQFLINNFRRDRRRMRRPGELVEPVYRVFDILPQVFERLRIGAFRDPLMDGPMRALAKQFSERGLVPARHVLGGAHRLGSLQRLILTPGGFFGDLPPVRRILFVRGERAAPLRLSLQLAGRIGDQRKKVCTGIAG